MVRAEVARSLGVSLVARSLGVSLVSAPGERKSTSLESWLRSDGRGESWFLEGHQNVSP